MAETVRELLVELGVDADNESLSKFDSGINKVKKGLGNLARAGTAVAGVIAGVGAGMVAAAKSTANYMEETKKAALQAGISTQRMSELRFAAEQLGIESDILKESLGEMSLRMQEAARGAGPAKKAFDRLGISLKNSEGQMRDTSAVFRDAVTKISQLESRAAKVEMVDKIFGGEARKLLPLINKGVTDIDKLKEKARELGVSFDKGAAQKAQKFNKGLRQLQGLFRGLKFQVGAELIPILNGLIKRFKSFVMSNQELIKSGIKTFVSDFVALIRGLWNALQFVGPVVEMFGGWVRVLQSVIAAVSALGAAWVGIQLWSVISGIAGALSGLAGMVSGLGAVFGTVGTAIVNNIALIQAMGFTSWLSSLGSVLGSALAPLAVAAAKFIAIAAAIFAVVLIIEDFITYLQGGKSLTGELVTAVQNWIQELDTLRGFIQSVSNYLSLLGQIAMGILVPAFNVVMAVGKATWTGIKQSLLTLWTIWKQIFLTAIAFMSPIFKTLLFLGRIAFMGIAAVVRWLWTSVIGPIVRAISAAFVSLYQGLASGFTWVAQTIRSAFSSVFGWIRGKLQVFQSWMKTLRKTISSILGVDIAGATEEAKKAAEGVSESGEKSDDSDSKGDSSGKGSGTGSGTGGAKAQDMPTVSGGKGGQKKPSGLGKAMPTPGTGAGGGRSGTGVGSTATSPSPPASSPSPSPGAGGMPGAGGATQQDVKITFGDIEVNVEQAPGETVDELVERVRSELQDERKQEIRQVQEAVKGKER